MTQEKLILHHLKTKGPITPLQALHLYGCFRLGARCYDLRQAGYNIKTNRVKTPGGSRIAEYTLV